MTSQKINFITITQVLAIHHYAVNKFGGSQGIRDLSLLESAIARPQSGFSGEYLYKNIFEMAAALFQSILKNYPFIDGNKRTALFLVGIFLKMNGYKLINQHQEELEFTINIDQQNLSIEEIAQWIEAHSIKIEHKKSR